MHYHAFHLHQKKLMSFLLSRNIKLSTRRTFRTPRMSQRTIDELQRGQELLKAEVKHLKGQMSLVMDLLQVVLKRECNTTPISASLVAALSSDVSMSQGHPHVASSPVRNFPTEYHPRPSPSKIPRKQQLLTPRSKKKEPNQHYRRYARQDIQPIPMSYSQLLPYLIQSGVVIPRELKPVPGVAKAWFDKSVRCAFHADSAGHETENCSAFKCTVQELIDDKILFFKQNGPSLDILLARFNHSNFEELPKLIGTIAYQEGVETLKNRDEVDQMFTSEKVVTFSKDISSSSKGKSVATPTHYPPLPSFKSLHQQLLSDLPQLQSQNSRNQFVPQNNLERRNAPIDPIPVTYSQLLPYLVQNSLVVPKFLKPPNLFPFGYDHNARCGYHAGTVGHSTEDCNAYKAKVQQLIDQKYLTLQGGILFVNGNPILK